MKKTVENIKRTGFIKAIASKSEIQRLLFVSAFSDKETVIENFYISEDISHTVECLKKFAADIVIDGNICRVIPYKEIKKEAEFYVGQNATLYRFLLAFCAFVGGNYTFIADRGLMKRPHTVLAKQLEKNGANIEYNGSFPQKISGKCNGKKYILQGNISSQYISAVLLASPVISGNTVIEVTENTESVGYINLTVDIMEKFGISVKKNDGIYTICEHCGYVSPNKITAGGDWSNAAYFLALGALGEITVNGLDLCSKQGDIRILQVLTALGADIKAENNSVTVKKNKLLPIQLNCADIPDLVPVISVLACGAVGVSTLEGVERLVYKETDRLQSIKQMITDLGGKIEVESNKVTVYGKGYLNGGEVRCNRDHRIIMAAAIAAQICKNKVVIDSTEEVKKSYPDFFKTLDMLRKEYG